MVLSPKTEKDPFRRNTLQSYKIILKYARDFEIFPYNAAEKCNLSHISEIEPDSIQKSPAKIRRVKIACIAFTLRGCSLAMCDLVVYLSITSQ